MKKVIEKLKEEGAILEKEIKSKLPTAKKQDLDYEWDFKTTDPVDFFDVNYSYQITGYKPINDTKGLDFNPDWFTEVREVFKRTGHYCEYLKGTKAYADFWTREYTRCRDGYTSHGYTVTGDHYFFLNYFQLMDLTSAKKAGAGRLMDFPGFFVAQYEFFHYCELAKVLRKNIVIMKARGVGYSEINAAIAANTYSCKRDSTTIISAFSDGLLSPTLEKVWNALTFLNDYTDGGFFKLRQVQDTQLRKRASHYKMINGQKVESGWMSQIIGIIADKPSKIRGYRTDALIYDEAGSWPNLKKAFIQGDALIGIQGSTFGYKQAGGTGGDSGPALEGLRDIYYTPDVYNVLPFRHNFTQDGEEALTAFFLPAHKIVRAPGYMDKRGFTNLTMGKAYYERERNRMAAKDPKALVIYQAEFCFTAEEAFSLEGDNKFNKALIAEQIAKIRLQRETPNIEKGELEFLYKSGGSRNREDINGVRWLPIDNGRVNIIEHPIWIKDKQEPIRDLYVAGIDSIDIGEEQTSEYTKDPSKFCIVIKKRVYGMLEPMYVAYYMARPDKIREAYKTAIRLLMYYNCKANIEATRLSMLTWARDNRFMDYFMPRPRATYPDINKIGRRTYGTPATLKIISHLIDLIADYVEDYCHTIWFTEFLDLLSRYSDENKTKFDIIAAMGMCELADEELNGVVPKLLKKEKEVFQDVGYYVDEKGYRHFGVIPKKTVNTIATWSSEHYGGIVTSDPRYAI